MGARVGRRGLWLTRRGRTDRPAPRAGSRRADSAAGVRRASRRAAVRHAARACGPRGGARPAGRAAGRRRRQRRHGVDAGGGLLAAGDAVDTGGSRAAGDLRGPRGDPGPVRRSRPDPRPLGRRRAMAARRLGRLAARVGPGGVGPAMMFGRAAVSPGAGWPRVRVPGGSGRRSSTSRLAALSWASRSGTEPGTARAGPRGHRLAAPHRRPLARPARRSASSADRAPEPGRRLGPDQGGRPRRARRDPASPHGGPRCGDRGGRRDGTRDGRRGMAPSTGGIEAESAVRARYDDLFDIYQVALDDAPSMHALGPGGG